MERGETPAPSSYYRDVGIPRGGAEERREPELLARECDWVYNNRSHRGVTSMSGSNIPGPLRSVIVRHASRAFESKYHGFTPRRHSPASGTQTPLSSRSF